MLMQELHLLPWEIEALTISEISVALSDGKAGSRYGRAAMSPQEMKDYNAWYKSLGPLGRLDAARAGKL